MRYYGYNHGKGIINKPLHTRLEFMVTHQPRETVRLVSMRLTSG